MRRHFSTFILTLLLWLSLAFIVLFIDPRAADIIPIFFFLSFLTLFFTLSALFANRRRGFTIALSLIFFLLLRFFDIGNILNLSLLLGIIIALEIYLSN